MMKKLSLAILIIALLLVTVTGCVSKKEPIVVEPLSLPTLPQNVIVTEELVRQLKSGMTYAEAVLILGTDYTDMSSVMNPERLQWEMNDGRTFTLVVTAEDYDEFWKDMADGRYVLPDETTTYDSNGFKLGWTENESNAVANWSANRKISNGQIREKDGTYTQIF